MATDKSPRQFGLPRRRGPRYWTGTELANLPVLERQMGVDGPPAVPSSSLFLGFQGRDRDNKANSSFLDIFFKLPGSLSDLTSGLALVPSLKRNFELALALEIYDVKVLVLSCRHLHGLIRDCTEESFVHINST